MLPSVPFVGYSRKKAESQELFGESVIRFTRVSVKTEGSHVPGLRSVPAPLTENSERLYKTMGRP